MTQNDWVALLAIVSVSAALAAILSDVFGAVPADPSACDDDDNDCTDGE